MLDDTFFFRTGIEAEQLEMIFAYRKIIEDDDYKSMKKDFDATIKMIMKDAQDRGKI